MLKIEVEKVVVYDYTSDDETPIALASVEVCDEYTVEVTIKQVAHNAASWRDLADAIAAAIKQIHPEHQP